MRTKLFLSTLVYTILFQFASLQATDDFILFMNDSQKTYVGQFGGLDTVSPIDYFTFPANRLGSIGVVAKETDDTLWVYSPKGHPNGQSSNLYRYTLDNYDHVIGNRNFPSFDMVKPYEFFTWSDGLKTYSLHDENGDLVVIEFDKNGVPLGSSKFDLPPAVESVAACGAEGYRSNIRSGQSVLVLVARISRRPTCWRSFRF